jgi:transcriptional regulator
MYIPAHFNMEDIAEIRTFLKAHPFGMLLSNGSHVPDVTHVPLQLMTDDGEMTQSTLICQKQTLMRKHLKME